jgi:hypothetical protein
VNTQRRRCATDISKPLKNSFIHTGHGDPGGKSWGNAEYIDEYGYFFVIYRCFFCVDNPFLACLFEK